VTTFEPFRAIRYTEQGDASTLLAPPYDVLNAADRDRLIDSNQTNSVRLDFPPGKEDPSAYAAARSLLDSWRTQGVLATDDAPTFTIMRMTAPPANDGTPGRATTGVLGALALEQPGTGDILPHEQTTAKDKADRLNLIRATEINTSPIWGLSMSEGLGSALSSFTNDIPSMVGYDEDGVRHEAWIISGDEQLREISAIVQQSPVVIADGHHRFETGLAYLNERSSAPGEARSILAYIVELAPNELEVRPIHRLLDLPEDFDLASALAPHFEVSTIDELDPTKIVAILPELGALAAVQGTRAYYLRAKTGAFDPAISLDSERLRAALDATGANIDVTYHHDFVHLCDRTTKEANKAAIALRPATVDQIRAVANARTRMPAKTTFFWPKPRTGILFRPVS
jgi:uncharacterized protein (DUF1015 family)